MRNTNLESDPVSVHTGFTHDQSGDRQYLLGEEETHAGMFPKSTFKNRLFFVIRNSCPVILIYKNEFYFGLFG